MRTKPQNHRQNPQKPGKSKCKPIKIHFGPSSLCLSRANTLQRITPLSSHPSTTLLVLVSPSFTMNTAAAVSAFRTMARKVPVECYPVVAVVGLACGLGMLLPPCHPSFHHVCSLFIMGLHGDEGYMINERRK